MRRDLRTRAQLRRELARVKRELTTVRAALLLSDRRPVRSAAAAFLGAAVGVMGAALVGPLVKDERRAVCRCNSCVHHRSLQEATLR